MSTKIKVPKGWYIVRNASRVREGDRFKAADGRWMGTSDAGRLVCHGGTPNYPEHPQYAGIYIRRIPKKRKSK